MTDRYCLINIISNISKIFVEVGIGRKSYFKDAENSKFRFIFFVLFLDVVLERSDGVVTLLYELSLN